MEKFQPNKVDLKEELELSEHAGIEQPELQLPTPTPEIEKKPNISPELLNDLIKNIDKQEEQDDKRNNTDTPTIH